MATSSEADTENGKPTLFKLHKSEGKRLLKEGNVRGALHAFEKAVECQPDERLETKMKKIREFLASEQDQEGCDNDMVEIGKGFFLYEAIERKLYAYQKEGLLWMWGLHLKKRGGVLGDDMGLGKTIQVVAFLSGMFDGDMIKSVLLVMPVSLIANWKKEFQAWAPGIAVYEYHSASKKERERNLARVQRRGGVLLTSYGMTQTNYEAFCTQNGSQFLWCYLILDEGHKIKNPTKTTKAIYEIPAKHRLVLTGTAIQNNLQELWALFNFTHQGGLVGSLATFKRQYETPINRAREKDATAGERLLGKEMSAQLRDLIQPYFLRRTKAEVLEDKVNSKDDKASLCPKLTFTSKKNDLVIWIYLSELQKKIYREFLESKEVANILMTKKSPLVQLTVLKKICDHPRLLSKRACVQMGMYDGMSREEIEEFLDREEGMSMSIGDVSDVVLLKESGKMTFVLQLLAILRDEGHRTLLFSQSRKILDIIQRILTNRGFVVTRLDGTINKLCERDRIVSQFQTKNSADVFLLTTQVGGVGLTLTSADRVIIYDPSWNPATDAQAVDRAYRIGQQKNVVVYRLITCSSVEEKIYRRQIFKDSIIKQTTGKQKDPMRYFTKQELRELFTLENPNYSGTQVQLHEMHSQGRNTNPALEDHIAVLQKMNIFGVSHHDLMFSEESQADAQNEFVPGEIEHVKERARMAQRMITFECDMALDEIQNKESYTVPMNMVVKPRPAEPRARSPKRNGQNSVPNDHDGGKSSKWNKALVVLDDDGDAVCLDGVGSLNKSLANMTVQSSDKSVSILVDDSDEELFPTAEHLDSVVIDSDEFSDGVEVVDSPVGTKIKESSFKLGVATAEHGTSSEAKTEEQENEAHDWQFKMEQPIKQQIHNEDGGVVTDRSFPELCESAARLVPEVKSEHKCAEWKLESSFSQLNTPPSPPEKGSECYSLRSSWESAQEVTSKRVLSNEEPDSDAFGTSLYTVEHEKRHEKKRLWDSPNQTSFVQTKQFLLSPTAAQKEGDSEDLTAPKGLGTPQNFSAKLMATTTSPVKLFHSTPKSTPSKRIAPLFVGSPQQQGPLSCQKMPQSPFQEALAKSVEYDEANLIPLKVREGSAPHSNSAMSSVHEISSEDEQDDSDSEDDVVVRKHPNKKAIVVSDSDYETP
ncbi:DNA excision repair protein ERCC-6-like [Amblyomma americanum]